ncbi:TetR/AcrR family transcriptional regulator [Primorskyibacter sp. S187A]|uniref:TetR/AcrR family transcriptional regulator n=1 Tax=Primorskyibacter sp. S187A TaxID=3415130 RepID=UPI003C7AC6A9
MTASDDPRVLTILQAASQSFGQYGYRKTSMEDIARAASMSRPALYQFFPNKEAIFRALCIQLFAAKTAALRLALAQTGRTTDVLRSAVRAEAQEFMAVVLESPHGQELMDVGHAVAADIATGGEAEIVNLYAAFFDRHGASDAPQLAQTFLEAKGGLKVSGRPRDDYMAHLDRLAFAFGALLERPA